MSRDRKILLAFVGAIPAVILGLSTLTTWAISAGAPMKLRLLFRLMCHGRIERSLELFGVPMPICARCAGIYLGLMAGLAAFWLVQFVSEKAFRIAAFVAVTPLAIDGLTQLSGLRESTNELRIATGLIAGLAFGLWILSAVGPRDETAFNAP